MRNLTKAALGAAIGTVLGAVMAFVIFSVLTQTGAMLFSPYDGLNGYYPLVMLMAFLGVHGSTCGALAGRFGMKTVRGGLLGLNMLLAWVIVIVLSYSLFAAISDPPEAWHPETMSFVEIWLRIFTYLAFMAWIFVAMLVIPSIVNGAMIGFLTSRITNRKGLT